VTGNLEKRIAKLEAQRLPRPAPRLVWIEPDEPWPDDVEGDVLFLRWMRDDEEPNEQST